MRGSKVTGNPGSGSGSRRRKYTLPRRSSRLLAKRKESAISPATMTQLCSRIKPPKSSYTVNGTLFIRALPCHVINQPVDLAMMTRRAKRYEANEFRSAYTYGSITLEDGCNNNNIGMKDQKTCISSSGTHTWQVDSSGIMWVAVHGMNSICVVTRNDYLDVAVARLGSYYSITELGVLKLFPMTLISEMEDLANPSTESIQKFDKCIDKPFGVVSVIPCTNKVDEESVNEQASSDAYDEKKAIKFLQDKIEGGSTFTVTETVQTAMSAFLHLFNRELTANEIQVSLSEEEYFSRQLEVYEVEEHLAVINKPDSLL